MPSFSFADRYAEAGLAPGADIITARQAPAARIAQAIKSHQLLELAAIYYGTTDINVSWLRDEFAKEDASFSLIKNEREIKVLAAIILGSLVEEKNSQAILAVVIGNVAGRRQPAESTWLVAEATGQFQRLAISNRVPARIETKIQHSVQSKLGDEIIGITANDWVRLIATMTKMRNDYQLSLQMMAAETTATLDLLNDQLMLLREESQMLWWLHGGHSRSLERSFSTLAPAQAALVGAIDLAMLTTVSPLGPVAAPALLERMINLSRPQRKQATKSLAAAVDGLERADLKRLSVQPNHLPPRLAPVTAALDFVETSGIGAWHQRFTDATDLNPNAEFEPLELAAQLYCEQILEHLL